MMKRGREVTGGRLAVLTAKKARRALKRVDLQKAFEEQVGVEIGDVIRAFARIGATLGESENIIAADAVLVDVAPVAQ